MSDRAILTLFYWMVIGWMSGEFIKRVTRASGEVQTEIHYNLDFDDYYVPNVYDEEENPGRA